MNDRQMKRLMDMMEASAGAVVTGHDMLNDPEFAEHPEVRDLARKCHDEGALRLALIYSDFFREIINRRHATGNFQYPFEPFDERKR